LLALPAPLDTETMGDLAKLSRDFRVLVASIRDPLEVELADRALSAARRARLQTLHRDITRLLQLVNTMFDVSMIDQAPRAGAGPVDLSAETVLIPMLRDSDLAGAHERSPLDDHAAASSTEPEPD
jgi:signal transduction histidine kinase